jgi:hypothetical protein
MKLKLDGYVARMRELINACKASVGKPERKRSLKRYKHTRVGNIETDVNEI